ncbi:DUF4265 domain-containing protein [Streptomyces sp. JJ36]|uniref:DUF4265 domain-containing protein n=1 Tax=Streptomyces sp. JJ36 TaxID=2736645 RepID=UPI001F25059E|nr:DUF4265 domain-containing protein [Streptomyces sp. JJ36]MCF6523102.1 DUF4265 domain-containing protein [Streptomyces sp. JJ36]
MDTAHEVIHIRLRQEGDWPPVAQEEVTAVPLGEHRYRLADPPAFAKRLAVGDVVRVLHHGEPEVPWIDELLEHSGHSTLRVIVFRQAGEAAERELADRMTALGATVHRTPLDGLLALDVPASVPYDPVRAALEDGEGRGLWEYEEGSVSAVHDAG